MIYRRIIFMDVNRYRNMTIERFLNHLYYSYAGLNRTLFNDAPYVPNGVAQDSFENQGFLILSAINDNIYR